MEVRMIRYVQMEVRMIKVCGSKKQSDKLSYAWVPMVVKITSVVKRVNVHNPLTKTNFPFTIPILFSIFCSSLEEAVMCLT